MVRVSGQPSSPPGSKGSDLANPPQLAQIQSPGVPVAALLQTGIMPGEPDFWKDGTFPPDFAFSIHRAALLLARDHSC